MGVGFLLPIFWVPPVGLVPLVLPLLFFESWLFFLLFSPSVSRSLLSKPLLPQAYLECPGSYFSGLPHSGERLWILGLYNLTISDGLIRVSQGSQHADSHPRINGGLFLRLLQPHSFPNGFNDGSLVCEPTQWHLFLMLLKSVRDPSYIAPLWTWKLVLKTYHMLPGPLLYRLARKWIVFFCRASIQSLRPDGSPLYVCSLSQPF